MLMSALRRISNSERAGRPVRTPSRSTFKGLVLAVALAAGGGVWGAVPSVSAQGEIKRHAISLLGEPAYKADFKHFGWVNPNAPKGGTVKLWSEGSFDNLNQFTLQGVAATGLGSLYDTLMTGSPDELNVVYGQIAAWASYPDDYSSITFGLRPEAKFHDGKPITPEDVIFSMEAQKKANMQIALAYKDVSHEIGRAHV